MLRNLSMCLISIGLLSGAGCKGNPADRGADLVTGAGSGIQPRAGLGPGGHGALTHRDDGTFALSSPDGAQVILLKKQMDSGPNGKEKGWYKVCAAHQDKLKCRDWQPVEVPCSDCFLEPCLCSNPVCTSACLSE